MAHVDGDVDRDRQLLEAAAAREWQRRFQLTGDDDVVAVARDDETDAIEPP